MNAEEIVDAILEGVGDDVEVEYRPLTIDSMPHVIWLMRVPGGSPSYVARGTGHSLEDAQRQVKDKAELLGVRVTKILNNVKQQ